MNCEQVKALCADYLAGELPETPRTRFEVHLSECQACREEIQSSQAMWEKLGTLPAPEPSAALDARFQAMLAAAVRGRTTAAAEPNREEPGARRARLADWLAWFWPRQPALQFGLAVILFGLGLVLGPALARHSGSGGNAPSGGALAELRNEVSGLKQMVALALLEQSSASERLRGVEWSHELPAPDDQVLSALLRALNSDPNVSVRLAAVEALQQFAGRAAVKDRLAASLPRQESPLVQIELIRLLVELKERSSIPQLKALLQTEGVHPTVREHAQWGLEQLG